MKLKIILPDETMVYDHLVAITAPGTEGYFQMYPKHADFVSTLKIGILTIKDEGEEQYIAINSGVLVKQDTTVYAACHQAIPGESLEELSKTVCESFLVRREKERSTNEVLAKMEIETLKKFFELE